jgi:hypothetical protein
VGHGVWRREGFLFSHQISGTPENQRPAFGILVHQAGIPEMFDKIVFSLYSGPRDFTNFRGIKFLPFFFVEFQEKGDHGEDGDEVDERVTDVTFVLVKVLV